MKTTYILFVRWPAILTEKNDPVEWVEIYGGSLRSARSLQKKTKGKTKIIRETIETTTVRKGEKN